MRGWVVGEEVCVRALVCAVSVRARLLFTHKEGLRS